MSQPAIEVHGLAKAYRLGAIGRQTFQEELQYWWLRMRGQDPRARMGTIVHEGHAARLEQTIRQQSRDRLTPDNRFWALRDVSFSVNSGEVLGIIGRNGAGKSTLLKILSRITEPTSGYADIEGRVGSLLEVGTGFHPDLTGRENVYMNGTILGMRKAEIDRKFDAIVDFAEIARFIDTPVKRYSSGMMVRLAFAVAAHLEPEILIVDEVLAVGDAQFQRKCIGKMTEVARNARTVLFVSHNMSAVESLCDRVIWIDEGTVRMDGETEAVMAEYLKSTAGQLAERRWTDPASAPGNDKLRILGAKAGATDGTSSPLTIRTPVTLEFDILNTLPDVHLSLNLEIHNDQGVTVFSTHSTSASRWGVAPYPAGRYRFQCHIPADLLNNGNHRVTLYAIQNQGIVLFRADDLLVFEIKDEPEARGEWHGRCAGAVRPRLAWDISAAT